MVRVAVSLALMILTGCAGITKPPVTASTPESVLVKFHTDPVTGRTDGPFDPETGRRVLTRIGDDGVLRVVIDQATHLPVVVPPDGEPGQPARP